MRMILTTATLLLLAGCATAPRSYDVQTTHQFQTADTDEVWTAVVELFSERGWSIDNMERASGIITTDWMSVSNGSYLDCGGSGIAVESGHVGSFNVFIREQDEAPTLAVNTSWRAQRSFGGTTGVVECVSTGVLEREIHEEVAQRVAAGGN